MHLLVHYMNNKDARHKCYNNCFIPVIQVLERKEWKNFRALVSSKPQLRRCGKRLPRYCDVNNDRKISITEWLKCLSTQRTNTGESCARTSVISRYFTDIVLSEKLLLPSFHSSWRHSSGLALASSTIRLHFYSPG